MIKKDVEMFLIDFQDTIRSCRVYDGDNKKWNIKGIVIGTQFFPRDLVDNMYNLLHKGELD